MSAPPSRVRLLPPPAPAALLLWRAGLRPRASSSLAPAPGVRALPRPGRRHAAALTVAFEHMFLSPDAISVVDDHPPRLQPGRVRIPGLW